MLRARAPNWPRSPPACGDRSRVRAGQAAQSDARHLLGLAPGRSPLEDEITAIALLGDAVIDLRGAKAISKEITIRACALLNDVDVIVLEGIAVELSGVAAGDNRNMTRPVPAGTSRFVVKIHGHAVLGDVQVLHSNPRAIRRRRSIED
jgi:hypothetical protein